MRLSFLFFIFFSVRVTFCLKASAQNISLVRDVCYSEIDSRMTTCAVNYKTVTVLAKSWQEIPQAEVCREGFEKAFMMTLGVKGNVGLSVNNLGSPPNRFLTFFSYLFQKRDQTILYRNVVMQYLNNWTFMSPVKIPLMLANLLSYSTYRELLGAFDSLMLIPYDSIDSSTRLQYSTIRISFKRENLMKFLCKGLKEAENLPQISTTLQCQILAILSSVMSCWGHSTFDLKSSRGIVFKENITEGIQFYHKPLCEKPNSLQVTYQHNIGIETQSIGIQMKDYNVSKSNPLPHELFIQDLEEENVSHYHLFMAAVRALMVLNSSVIYRSEVPQPINDLIPGWKMELITYVREDGILVHPNSSVGLPDDSVPFLFVSRFLNGQSQNDTMCDILIVSRGTFTTFEWRNDLAANTAPFLSYGPSEAMAHFGFVTLAKAVEPPLVNYVASLLKTCPVVTAYFTGHSLGGATTQVLALLLRERFKSSKLKINVSVFASPNVFNKAAAEYYAQNINSRNFRFAYDPVTRFPCSVSDLPKGYPRCTYSKPQSTHVETGHGWDIFHETPGIVNIPSHLEDQLYITADSYGKIHIVNDFFYLHGKAYKNWFSNYCI